MWQLIEGDCVEVMRGMAEASVDAIVTDPPYGLEFMGKEWDRLGDVRQPDDETFHRSGSGPHDRAKVRHGGYSEKPRWTSDHMGKGFKALPNFYMAGARMQEWHRAWAVEALPVLKPGGHLLAFGGSRTYHRLACALEDAGFDIRDCLAWLYGSGFPKSKNLEGGWGTALKPAFEPIVLARKPLMGTVEANVQAHGTGALNIDGARIGFRDQADEREAKEKNRHADFESAPRENRIYGKDQRDRGESGNYDPSGRWPANVVLDEEAAAMLDDQAGDRIAGAVPRTRGRSTFSALGHDVGEDRVQLDAGGASRFFYTAKADRREREIGMRDYLPDKGEDPLLWSSGEQSPGTFQAEGTKRRARNHHPTVKPVDLMQWLVRLVTPPGGLVLDPFCGSGSTGMAGLREGFRFIGIERDPEYIQIARARIVGDAPLFNVEGGEVKTVT